ncbi:MAG: S41 family peptidase [Rhodomicrobium sp.]
MRIRRLALGALLLVAASASGVFIHQQPVQDQALAATAQVYKDLELFGEVLQHVREEYVEKPDDKKLITSALNGMLMKLDPHSSYMSPKEFQEEQVETHGEFGGLGIDVTMEDGVLKVIAPIENMPAEKAGVLAGDAITALDGQTIKGLSMDQAVDRMRGPTGSPITLSIARKGVAQPIAMKIVRDIIRINPVKYSVEGDVGWIRIKSFENEHTSDYLQQAIEDIQKTVGPSLAGYVIDLRNNPGGLLDQAIAVSDAFLDRGVIVITKGRGANDVERASAKPGDLTLGKPIVILINGGSASASEIVAGALQDHKRALLVGTRSFGKGSVQTLIPLADHGALRLTTARYYTPSGRSIQATGIEPDYVVEPDLPADVKLQLSSAPLEAEAELPGHLKNGNAPEARGSISYVPREKDKDNQLKAAIDLLHGKMPPAEKPAGDKSGLQRAEASSPAAPAVAAAAAGTGQRATLEVPKDQKEQR